MHKEDLEVSETARATLGEYDETNQFSQEVIDEIEKETASLIQDKSLFDEYTGLIQEFTPWIAEAEKMTSEAPVKPKTLEDAVSLLDSLKAFDASCTEYKGKLDDGAKALGSMVKPSNTENFVESLSPRWDAVKKVLDARTEKVQILVTAWEELKTKTEDLVSKFCDVPNQNEPDLVQLETFFNTMKDMFATKKELVDAI